MLTNSKIWSLPFLGLRRVGWCRGGVVVGGVGAQSKERKGRDQILQRSIVESQSFKSEGPNAFNLRIWL